MEARVELLVWTAISILLGIVVVNAAYRAGGGRLVQFTEASLPGAVLREVGLFAFMIGVPFVALISGASGLDLMALGTDLASPDHVAGFTFINWLRGVGFTAVAVLGVLVVLWLGGRNAPHGERWHLGLIALRDALYNEAHWTFYRAAPTLWLGDPYWGVVAGAILVLLEWGAHPESVRWLRSVEGRQYIALRLACLLCSSFLYLATQNLWLMIAADLTIQLAGSRLLSAGGQADGPIPRDAALPATSPNQHS